VVKVYGWGDSKRDLSSHTRICTRAKTKFHGSRLNRRLFLLDISCRKELFGTAMEDQI
jgi:hypothetical protein